MKKRYSTEPRHVFGERKEGQYVLLAQGPNDAVPHTTSITGTDAYELQFIADLLNAAPDVLIDRIRQGKDAA